MEKQPEFPSNHPLRNNPSLITRLIYGIRNVGNPNTGRVIELEARRATMYELKKRPRGSRSELGNGGDLALPQTQRVLAERRAQKAEE